MARETPSTVLARFGVKDAFALRGKQVRGFVLTMASVAADHNRIGENHVAIDALIQAVLALAAAQADTSDGAEKDAQWASLAAMLREQFSAAVDLAKSHAAAADYLNALAYDVRARVFEHVLISMGEPVDETVDSMPELFGSVQDDPAGSDPLPGSADQ